MIRVIKDAKRAELGGGARAPSDLLTSLWLQPDGGGEHHTSAGAKRGGGAVCVFVMSVQGQQLKAPSGYQWRASLQSSHDAPHRSFLRSHRPVHFIFLLLLVLKLNVLVVRVFMLHGYDLLLLRLFLMNSYLIFL